MEYDGDDEIKDDNLLGYCAMQFCRTFQPSSSRCQTGTAVYLYQTQWCNIPEDSHLHTHHHENLKSHLNKLVPGTVKELVPLLKMDV
jgi:hypothetical protein